MKTFWRLLFAAVVVTLVLLLLYVADFPFAFLLSAGAGALCLLWLIVLLAWPWNLYFRARTVIHESRASREKGLDVPAERDAEAGRIARVMLVAAVGGHVVSAVVTAAIGWFAGSGIGYWFAGFYLLSTVFRPSGAYFGHLRTRLVALDKDVRYPRDDVLTALSRLDAVEQGVKRLEERAEEQYNALAETRRELEALSAGQFRAERSTDAKLAAVARQFDDTVTRMTDNQEVITGVKAFLRLLREEPV
ncbi:hypothetical protein [Streptomyces sp. NPDC060194]|uniref:hypothetical protein n=1 Tax=Streptomyces sp. NPDC060194 TaxID=3347069 RepID=UPI00365BBD43